VSAVLRMEHKEQIRLDREQLEALYASLGPTGADMVLGNALEDLALTLARLARHDREGRTDALRTDLRQLIALARQVGMTLLARVARDVLDLSESNDTAAFAATMARLERIGEDSLFAVWDIPDISG